MRFNPVFQPINLYLTKNSVTQCCTIRGFCFIFVLIPIQVQQRADSPVEVR